jgi:hypothetical protein
MDDLGNNTLLDVVVRYKNGEGNEEKAIVTIDENDVVHVKPFSEYEPCDCPTNPKETESVLISPMTKDPLEQLAEQIQDAITQLSPPTPQ